MSTKKTNSGFQETIAGLDEFQAIEAASAELDNRE